MTSRRLLGFEWNRDPWTVAVVLVATITLLAPASRSADLFVDAASGSDINDGLSWASAKATVNAALAAAAATPEPDVVTVASGEYRERIIMPAGVTLIGSVPAGGGSQDVFAHPSVLDAEYSGRVVYFGAGTDSSILDGFVVTRGYANDLANAPYGAGILVEESGVLIRHCRIEGNQANSNSALVARVLNAPVGTPPTRLEDCLVRSNRQLSAGMEPTIYMEYLVGTATVQLEPVLKNVVIEDNRGGSLSGSGALTMRANKTSIRFENVIVRRNTGYGMSLSLAQGASLVNCEVSDNSLGGVLMSFGGSQPWDEVKHYSLINCTLRANGFPALDGYTLFPEAQAKLEMRRCILAGTGQDILASSPGEGPGQVRLGRGSVGIDAVMDNLILRAPASLLPTNIDADPEFAAGPLGASYLSQVLAGQALTSPAVDAGDVPAADVAMDGLTTRTDAVGDLDACDLGVHYGFAAEPPPFVERFRVFSGQDRSSLQLRADAPDSEWTDVPGTLSDSSRPLVFYEVRFPSPPLTLTKQLATDSVQLSW